MDDRATLLVDDFAGQQLRNRLGGSNGIFNNSTAGGQLQAYRADQELVLHYDVSGVDQFAGYFTNLAEQNVLTYTTIDILVRGAVGGENLLIGLRDAKGFEPKLSVSDLLPGGITSEWKWVQVPLSAFKAELDRSAISNLSFTFEHGYAPTSGQVYIGEIRFTTLAAPLTIDLFDDENLNMNSQGLDDWAAAPNSSLTFTPEKGDATGDKGASLRLTIA